VGLGCACFFVTLGLGVVSPGHGWTREWPDAMPVVGYAEFGYETRNRVEIGGWHASLPSEPDGGVWVIGVKKRWEFR